MTTQLIHFGREKLSKVRSVTQDQDPAYKPRGLWVSVEGENSHGWKDWCEAEDWGQSNLVQETEIVLAQNAKVLRLSSATELDDFTNQYGVGSDSLRGIDWKRVAWQYSGIIIAPYIWERRLESHTMWYYGWDCASGCIWDSSAIKELR